MGKTIIGILEAAAVIAAFVTTGPQGAALVAAGISVLNSTILKPSTPKPEQVEGPLKSPTPARFSAYGRIRAFYAYALYETANDGTAVDVGALHDGRIDGFEQFYLGDDKVTLSGSTVQAGDDGRYRDGAVSIYTTLGNAVETAFAAIIALLPTIWTSAHRGDGVASMAVTFASVKSKHYQETYPSGLPPAGSAVIRAQLVYDWRDETQSLTDPTTWKWTENAWLHIAHYQMIRMKGYTAPGAIGPDATELTRVWNRYFAPTLDFWTLCADDADLPVSLKGVQVALALAAPHGDHHVAVGSVAGLAVGMTIVINATGRVDHTETRVVTSISGANINFSGDLAYDHPLGSSVTWASDPDSPAHEPRYRSCVSHKHTDPHKGVMGNLLACCDGWIVERSDGALLPRPGRYYPPTVTLGPDEIVSYSYQEGVQDEQAINEIALTYVSSLHDFNAVETDPWTDEDDIAARGSVRSDTLTNQVPSHSQARRLAKRKMAQVMAPSRGTITTNSGGRIAVGERFIDIELTEGDATFFTGPIEIMPGLTRNLATGGVTFPWVAVDPNIDAWNPATEEGNPAPVGNRVAPEPLDTPTITSATAIYADNSSAGGVGVKIDVSVDAPDRSDLTWYLRTKATSAAIWLENSYSDIDPGTSVLLETDFVPVDSSVDVEVAYGVGDGRVSDWSATSTVSTSTAAIAPAAPSEIAATSDVGHSVVSWRNPSSANLSHLKLFRGTSTFGAASAITGDLVGGLGEVMSVDDTGLAAGNYKYWIVAYNAGGNASSPDGPATATVT